jgi:hypothetical protein
MDNPIALSTAFGVSGPNPEWMNEAQYKTPDIAERLAAFYQHRTAKHR